MKKLISLVTLSLCFVFFAMNANAVPLTGTLNIPTDYPTLAAAINDLNLQGVGAGGVTLNLLAGNPQSVTAGGYVIGGAGSLVLTTTNASDQVIIEGNGNTVTASGSLTAGALTDAIFKLIGADYITIQNFVMQENAANIVNTPAASNNMTEWGVALLYVTTTDGSQNNTIQNNSITLNKTYLNTFGVYSNVRHTSTAVTTTADITNISGSNFGNKVYGNTISNVNMGITMIGSGVAANQDFGNDVGGSSASTGNTISNWGGAGALSGYISNSGTSYCIFMNHQTGDNISYNSITSAAVSGTAVTLRGIVKDYTATAPIGSFTSNITNNTVTMSSAFTSGTFQCIASAGMTALSTATININNNTVLNCVISGVSTTSILVGILNSSAPGVLSISNNIIRGNTSTATTGGFTGISNSGAVITTNNINSNQIGNGSGGAVSFSAITTGTVTCISNTGGAATCALSISSNNFQGVSYATASSGAFLCINTTALVLSETINSNNFNNLTVNTSNSTLGFLIGSTNATPTVTIDGNFVTTQFSNTNATGGANYIAIANNIGATGPTTGTTTISNNNISNVTYKTTTGFGAMFYWVSGSGAACTHNITVNLNTITNISNTGGTAVQTAGSYGILASNGSTNAVTNNTVTSIYAAGGSAIGIFGGAVSSNAAGVTSINNNLIQDIKSTSVSTTVGTNAIGIQVQGGPGNNVFKNKIFDINHTGIGTVTGLVIAQGTVGSITNVYDNLIGRLNAPGSFFFQAVRGINVANAVVNTVNISYNNVYFDGNCGGQSYCLYMSSVNPTITVKNNILINKAVPTSALEQMVYFRVGTLTSTYSVSSDNNLLYAGTPGPLNLIYADGAVNAVTNQQQTLPAFKTFAGPVRESYSYSGDPVLLTDLSPDPSNPACWLINGNGIAMSNIGTDINGNPRSTTIAGGGTDIGAYEFTPSVAPPVESSGPLLSPLASTNFNIGTATVASVNVTSGSVSNVDFQYYSGTVPPGLPGSPPVTDGYGNVYWNFVPSGTGFTYDLVIHYSPALLGTTVESAIKVAIEDPLNNGQGFYTPYPQGTGTAESDVDFTNHNITVRGLTDMGKFIITDATSALPVELASFVSEVNGRNVNLNWATSTESNNSGFDIERSVVNGAWSKVGNVAGNGTSSTGHSYSFTDRNVASGNFSYRLKQIDFNGNFEYFNLNNEVNVGIPTKYELSQNYPNPFNPSTKINYDIPFDGKVSLTIFDMSGKEIASLVNEVKTAGYYSVNFNASSLSSGTYFYRINAEGNGQNFVSTKKMMLVK